MILRTSFAMTLALLTLPAGPLPATAETQAGMPRDITIGDPRRRTLLNVLRPAIEKDLGQKVQFVVRVLRTQGRWAFAHVVPQAPPGQAIDFRRTRYADLIRQGMFDGPDTFALMENKGGRWTLRAFVVGPTDVTYADWPEEFGAPHALFGLPEP